jgi:hypothetical protein
MNRRVLLEVIENRHLKEVALPERLELPTLWFEVKSRFAPHGVSFFPRISGASGRQSVYECNALAFPGLQYGPTSASLYRKNVDVRR